MMLKTFLEKSALIFKATFLCVMAVAVVSCADYKDMNKEAANAKADYYAYESALLEPETLKNYIDAGHKTPDGKKVVIINVDGTVPATVIKGALPMPQNSYFTEVRNDGPINVGNMVASGAKMDAAIRFAGIDANTLVVITGATLGTNNIHRVWWTFSYWGFSNKYVKILNGANKYFTATYPDYMVAPGAITVTPSTYSVKDLPGNNIDAVRAPLGEVLEDVIAGNYKADGTGVKILIPTMAANKSIMNGATEATKVANIGKVSGRIRGATQLIGSSYLADDGRYKTAEEIAASIVTFENMPFLPVNKNTRIIVHCGGGQSTAPHFFAIKEILGYRNTAIYDGSWNEWGNLTRFVAKTADETFAYGGTAQTSYLTWDFNINKYVDSITSGVIQDSQLQNTLLTNGKFDTSKYTDWLTLAFTSHDPASITIDNTYSGDAREIHKTDKLYQETKGGDSSSTDKPAQGGGAPSGC